MKPVEVTNENSHKVFRKLYPAKKNIKPKFSVGQKVRISYYKNVFEKGYTQSFTEEIFTIDKVHQGNPPYYFLKDYDGDLYQGIFYDHELALVIAEEDRYFDVEKVLKTRTRKGVKESLVRWKGLSSKFDSWVTDIIDK